MSENIKIIDRIEDLVLMALESSGFSAQHELHRNKGNGCDHILLDAGSVLHFDTGVPSSFYTFQIGGEEDDRVFATGSEYLSAHPSEIIGEEKQFAMFFEDYFKWVMLRKTKRPSKKIFALGGSASCWYEYHYREVSINGRGVYKKRIIPFDKLGNPLMASCGNGIVGDPSGEGIFSIVGCSIIEDAHRADAMLCTVKDSAEIKFPVPISDYKEIFSIRDSQLSPSGRKKAILHWVAGHLRNKKKGGISKVKNHVRGIKDFDIDGIKISITENKKPAQNQRANAEMFCTGC